MRELKQTQQWTQEITSNRKKNSHVRRDELKRGNHLKKKLGECQMGIDFFSL